MQIMVTFFSDPQYQKVMRTEGRVCITPSSSYHIIQIFCRHRWGDQSVWYHWVDRSMLPDISHFSSSVSLHDVTVIHDYHYHHQVTEWFASIPKCVVK